MTFQWPKPAWLDDLPEAEREAACLRFHLSLAALYGSPEMSDQQLSRALGLHHTTVGGVRKRAVMSPEMAIRIEQKIGRELFPREIFRPDLFLVSE